MLEDVARGQASAGIEGGGWTRLSAGFFLLCFVSVFFSFFVLLRDTLTLRGWGAAEEPCQAPHHICTHTAAAAAAARNQASRTTDWLD